MSSGSAVGVDLGGTKTLVGVVGPEALAAELGPDAGMIGAATMALDELHQAAPAVPRAEAG